MKARVVVLTGAGISADSGLATFRDSNGLWEGHRPEEVATPGAWRRDPGMVWRFYQMRRAALLDVEPNAAHVALAEWEERLRSAGVPATLVTQNVDDLHERGGLRSPIHMHGELAVLACERCGEKRRDLEFLTADEFLPCASCGHERVRPDVVWFGEIPYQMDEITAAVEACTHFVSIGTSGVVYPAAGFLAAARAQGARTWVNSLDPPENLDPADEFVPGRAVDAVPLLLERLADEVLG